MSAGAQNLARPRNSQAMNYRAINAMITNICVTVNPAGLIVTYNYEKRGLRSRMIDPQGGRFSYTYDELQRLITLVNPQSSQTSMKYDPAGRMLREILGNGCITTLLWDAAGQKTGVFNGSLAGLPIINRFSYLYDQAGNR